LIASIAIGDGVVACCCLSCLSTMHSCDDAMSAVIFLTILSTKRGNHHSMIDSFYFIALQAIGRSI
jgi:hypothetical protein